jgi:uncharacterized protein DUF4062/squalene-hopene cyclase-like protein/prenyltransferase/squalene oxidase-like repeat protein
MPVTGPEGGDEGMDESIDARTKVFVSSTYEDLKDYRSKCIEVLEKLKQDLGIDWVGMENFGAEDSSPKDYCLSRVKDSGLYLGIFGMRYGSVDNDSGRSITELEYRMAKQRGLPCLIYLMDEQRALITPSLIEAGSKADKLQDLKKELSSLSTGHIVGVFHSPENLASQLAVDLVRSLKMLKGYTNTLGGLRKRIDVAIAEGCRFIRDMENVSVGGWSYFTVGHSTSWDTATSLLALAASEEAGCMAALHRGQHWLIGERNPHGGWHSSWEQNAEATTTVDTAIALLALIESGYDEHPLHATTNYLRQAQHPDGGWPETFGYGPPATASTAWALRALIAAKVSPAEDCAQRALRWLLEQQWSDGGWAATPWAACSTVGKTSDVLMALSLFEFVQVESAVLRGQEWLTRARAAYATVEDFGRSVGAEPHGVNPTIENILLFLEGAFCARIPPGDPCVRSDLEWITARRWWGFSPRAVRVLCQYRKWVT